MTQPAAPTGARYRAFISYSHADAGFGRRLHRQLEGYAVPGRIVGRVTARGAVPRRLAPIFRDREELPAADDLSAEVRSALAQSGALVVVCSPRAASSPWVGREVALFRELHPDRPVLAALIAGEPGDAFPDILRSGGAEPLAADFRPGRDGARLGLLKLVAGIVGVGLDELVQRDAQRRLRGVMGVTAASVAAMLAMGVLTAFALNARAEAERERAKAEGLVEFMITDLRTRLEGVNSLEIMSAVNQRALAYYADQDLKVLEPDSLVRRAAILHAMGEDDETAGNLDLALAKFREANRTTAAVLAASPNDPERIFAQAQSEFWVAYIHLRKGEFAAAEAGFERYAGLADRLLNLEPGKARSEKEVAYAANNLGMMALRDRGDAATAEKTFLRAVKHFQAAGRLEPAEAGHRRDLANGYAWLADSQAALGHFDRARETRLKEQQVLLALSAAEPKNELYRRDLLGNALGLARIDLRQGRRAEGVRRLEEALAEARRLAAGDPANAKIAKQRIALGLFLAQARLVTGDRAAARPALAECPSETAQGDEELRDFCAVVAAQLARAEGRSADPTFDYLRLNRERMTKVRRSPRWGIDFGAEMENLS